MLEDMRSRLAPADLVADIGRHSVSLGALYACQFIAFEPHPEAFAAPRENAHRNGVSARFEARYGALGGDEGFVCWPPIESERLAASRRFRHEMAGRQAASAS